ncbi:MAG: flavodoxin family protein [Firmicutes bacterium]|nr:flavodoxin family protein [Bacillota bacterium]
MKAIGICGSTRKNGTDFAVRRALEILEKEYGVETTYFTVRGKKINMCIHCNDCVRKNAKTCTIYTDDISHINEEFLSSDVIILGSPIFEMGMSPQMSAILSRTRCNYNVLKENPNVFYDKLGMAIAVGGARNGGQEMTINSLHGFFHTNGIIPIGASMGVYAGAGIWSKDTVPFTEEVDEYGIKNLDTLTRKLGETLKLIKGIK